ncbi:helix-turn-helix domain-containing protein [Mycolicibacterium septicum]|uniref:Helix-turn-helix domain-containing protein n=1 Tax=Mycolicibacterium septicum TaxID=98668 RepID=A0ABW9LRU6_9MYCO
MITGFRGVVLLDSNDAAYLAAALGRLSDALAGHGLRPSEQLVALRTKLAKACASASDSTPDTCADIRTVGAQQDSQHTALYDLVDTDEAARILGCTPANVRDLARRGRLPAHRAGRGWLYPAASVVARAEHRAAKRG